MANGLAHSPLPRGLVGGYGGWVIVAGALLVSGIIVLGGGIGGVVPDLVHLQGQAVVSEVFFQVFPGLRVLALKPPCHEARGGTPLLQCRAVGARYVRCACPVLAIHRSPRYRGWTIPMLGGFGVLALHHAASVDTDVAPLDGAHLQLCAGDAATLCTRGTIRGRGVLAADERVPNGGGGCLRLAGRVCRWC